MVQSHHDKLMAIAAREGYDINRILALPRNCPLTEAAESMRMLAFMNPSAVKRRPESVPA